MIEFISSTLAGFIGHMLERPTAHWFPRDAGDDDLNRLISYIEGGLILRVMFGLLLERALPHQEAKTAAGVFDSVLMGVGVGTVMGYISDGIGGRK